MSFQPGAMGLQPISAKTASYTLVPKDLGTLFTTRGASGAITFTLPPNADLQAGWYAEFYNVADQNMIVASSPADTMVAHNDAAADSVAFQTASELIGNAFKVVWDGTGWLVMPSLAADTVTVTVAT